MADPVVPAVDPAPSPSTPVVDPAASAADPAKAAAPAADPAKTPAAPVAPEKYDFTAVKLPKGIELDSKLIDAVSPVFKTHKVSQEVASALIETHANYLAAAEVKREADFQEFMKTTVTNYQAQIRKEWGAEHDANVVIAQKGMARVFSADAKKLLDDTGLGNHPELLKAFFQVGKMVSEDKPPAAGTPAGRKSNEAVFYGATTQ